jgi:hypothetical protein
MKIAVTFSGRFGQEILGDLASFLLYDPLGIPILVGLEYVMPEGLAWTIAEEADNDFYRILGTSGVLHSVVPGFKPGRNNLLCTPVLRKGIPRWFDDASGFVVSTDQNIPFFLAYKNETGNFCSIYYHSSEFRDRLQWLWQRR